MEPLPSVGDKNQSNIFYKFYLNNGKGRRIQVVMLENDIHHFEHHIMLNHVSIHIIN